VLLPDGAGLGDGELLDRFIERHDEAAFTVLIDRHGPMVWGVCRRLLHRHDAEDAFQATFLVLARKAASIRSKEMVGNWLYGVAHQTALQARRTAARRRAREVQVGMPPLCCSGVPSRKRPTAHFLTSNAASMTSSLSPLPRAPSTMVGSRPPSSMAHSAPQGLMAWMGGPGCCGGACNGLAV
jgi:DNA-directed RNA polymerase specialized sigma24 family protein